MVIQNFPNKSGITPSGTINITENGSVNVTDYAIAQVLVEGGGGIPRHQVPQSGTWQFKTTPKTGCLIIGHDEDTADSAKFVRMVTGYGYPVTLNTESFNQSDSLGNDADGEYTTYPVGSVSRFPEGTTVNALNKTVIAQNLGEVAQHDTSGGKTWDSSLLTGTVLDNYYATYTSGGGIKSEEDFKDAIIEKYAATDVEQGASRVAAQRAILEAALNNPIDTIGMWGGTPVFTIDDIDIGNTTPLLCGTQKISRAQNYMGDGLLNETNSQNPYRISRFSSGLTPESITGVLTAAYNDKRCIEAFQHYYLDGTQAKWDDFKTTMDTIKEWVDQGKIQVVTRKQYYELGEFVDNPIASLRLTTSKHEYVVGDTVSASDFICKAILQDNTLVDCGIDKMLDYSAIDTTTVGTYIVSLEYRGFKTTLNVSVVATAFNLPDYVKNASSGYYQYVRFANNPDICYCLYLTEESNGFSNSTTPPGTSQGWYIWYIASRPSQLRTFYSSDGSTTWTQLHSGTAPSNAKTNSDTWFGEYTFDAGNELIRSNVIHIEA